MTQAKSPDKLFCDEKKEVIKNVTDLVDTLDDVEAELKKEKDPAMQAVAKDYAEAGTDLLVILNQEEHLSELEAFAVSVYNEICSIFFSNVMRIHPRSESKPKKGDVKEDVFGIPTVKIKKEDIIEARLHMKGKRVD